MGAYRPDTHPFEISSSSYTRHNIIDGRGHMIGRLAAADSDQPHGCQQRLCLESAWALMEHSVTTDPAFAERSTRMTDMRLIAG